ncbi:MAG: ice-binding family protein [Myxococcales bacterium]
MKTHTGLSMLQAVAASLALWACGSPSSGPTGGGDASAGSNGGSSSTSRASSGGSAATTGGGSATGGGSTGGSSAAPAVLASLPPKGSTAVALNTSVSATFSEAMDASTLTTATFTLTSGSPPTSVPGTVVYASSKTIFWPSALLASNTPYTATITTGAKSSAGVAIAESYSWGFTTGTTPQAGVPIDLGTAAGYVILAEAGISTVTPSTITGNLGISPAAATYITGFSLSLAAGAAFSTSAQVTGDVYAPGYADPTPANLTTAIGDMNTAFTAAAGRAPDVTDLGAGDISGLTLPAGVYSWGTGLLLATDVTLSGSSTDVWIFQVAQNLTVSNGVILHLSGGALPKNVFWQVSGSTSLGTTVQFAGTLLDQTAIALETGASLTGRLLAQTAVTLDANTVVSP